MSERERTEGEDGERAGQPKAPLEEGVVRVEGGTEGFRSAVLTSDHRLVADESEEAGGEGLGPDPYELLLAGLGACKVMTMRMYADRKGWPLEGSSVTLEHDRVHAEDCASCDTEERAIDRIRVVIRLEGDLDAEQRERLVEIAGRCPVHRTLTSETRIEHRLE